MSVTNWMFGPDGKRHPLINTQPRPGTVNGMDLIIDGFANLMLPGANHYVNWIQRATQKPGRSPRMKS